jgi:gluconolactonase
MSASEPRYTIHDDRFRRMILGNARLETLGDGFGWTEGPVWFADHAMLVFSDVPGNREWCWREGACEGGGGGGGISIYRELSDHANGHARDRQGRLLTCSHGRRAVLRRERDGVLTVLTDSYDRRRLNSPNDIVCRSDGTVWFTDPTYGIETDFEGTKARSENAPAVYRLDPRTGELVAAITGLAGPNGLAFSPDERQLYVSDSGDQFAAQPQRSVLCFAVSAAGTVGVPSSFAVVTPGYADGMAVDEAGNVWLSAGDGVHCHAPDGTLLGCIHTAAPVANLCFGGRARARLFLCAAHSLLAIHVNVRGLALV